MGRSRGGLTTRIHAFVDMYGRPIHLKLTTGQAHDGRSASAMLGTLRTGRVLLADRAYDSDDFIVLWLAKGVIATIRLMSTRKHFPAFDHMLYQKRNAVERFFNKLQQLRAIATRYDKRDDNFLASVQHAAMRIWLKTNESVS